MLRIPVMVGVFPEIISFSIFSLGISCISRSFGNLRSKKDIILCTKSFSSIYLGVLNEYDLISSKLLRGTQVDIDDCRMLMEHKGDEIDKKRLRDVYRDYTSYQLNPEKANRTFDLFIEGLGKEG